LVPTSSLANPAFGYEASLNIPAVNSEQAQGDNRRNEPRNRAQSHVEIPDKSLLKGHYLCQLNFCGIN
jgi:hypothetical protein